MDFLVGGMITSSGLIYAALLAESKKSRAETAWVSSLGLSTCYLFFPMGAVLSQRYGCWVVALVGNITCSVGLLCSSFVKRLPLLYLTYGTVWGIGASFMYFASLLILTKHFKARLAFANGISLGQQQQMQLCLETFQLGKKPTTTNNLFSLPYKVRLAEDIGIDKTRASFLLTFATVGSGLGRVTFGRISDVQRLNRVYIAQVAFLVVGLSNFVFPMTESYVVSAGDAFIFGFFGASYLVLNPVIVYDILGPDKVSSGLGLIFFAMAISGTVGPLIAGWIFDWLQSYAIAFYTLGATTCVSSILIIFVTILMRRKSAFDIPVAERKIQLKDENNIPITTIAFKSLIQ
ncbi:monocarboxylate transporter 10-like [Acropora palmata]|uniref:monocarboxylate transporter 10-like n=1 Tax=Acropora palmata TaxID=6131 RepID=UPI003DA16028